MEAITDNDYSAVGGVIQDLENSTGLEWWYEMALGSFVATTLSQEFFAVPYEGKWKFSNFQSNGDSTTQDSMTYQELLAYLNSRNDWTVVTGLS